MTTSAVLAPRPCRRSERLGDAVVTAGPDGVGARDGAFGTGGGAAGVVGGDGVVNTAVPRVLLPDAGAVLNAAGVLLELSVAAVVTPAGVVVETFFAAVVGSLDGAGVGADGGGGVGRGAAVGDAVGYRVGSGVAAVTPHSARSTQVWHRRPPYPSSHSHRSAAAPVAIVSPQLDGCAAPVRFVASSPT